jgi:hypothetical protein
MEPVQGLIDRHPAGVLGWPLSRLPRRLGGPAPALVHGDDRDMTIGRRERQRRTDRGRLEGRSVIEQDSFQRLAEVLHEMKPIDHLHRLGGSLANAVGIQVAAIATEDGERRVLREPGRERGGRAVPQQVHNAMRHEIDQDRAIAMASSPGPLVHPP